VLPGDVNQNGVVQANDGLTVRAALGTSTSTGGLYSVFKDINANSIIQANDGLAVRSRLGTSLPAGEPGSGMGGLSAPLSEGGGVPAPLSDGGGSRRAGTPSAVTSPAASPSIPIPTSNLSGSGAFDVLAAAAPVGERPRRASSVSASASNAGAASGILVDTSTPISDSLYDLEGNRRGAGLIRSLICSGR
jgi:hypothetical protein